MIWGNCIKKIECSSCSVHNGLLSFTCNVQSKIFNCIKTEFVNKIFKKYLDHIVKIAIISLL